MENLKPFTWSRSNAKFNAGRRILSYFLLNLNIVHFFIQRALQAEAERKTRLKVQVTFGRLVRLLFVDRYHDRGRVTSQLKRKEKNPTLWNQFYSRNTFWTLFSRPFIFHKNRQSSSLMFAFFYPFNWSVFAHAQLWHHQLVKTQNQSNTKPPALTLTCRSTITCRQ